MVSARIFFLEQQNLGIRKLEESAGDQRDEKPKSPFFVQDRSPDVEAVSDFEVRILEVSQWATHFSQGYFANVRLLNLMDPQNL